MNARTRRGRHATLRPSGASVVAKGVVLHRRFSPGGGCAISRVLSLNACTQTDGEKMANPVLVEVLRGQRIESRHRGAVAVCDAQGGLVVELGDVETPVFPRSSVKLIQALPLIETGAADTLGFRSRELALACASHSGEEPHAELALSMLQRAGLDETALECGVHWPTNRKAAMRLAVNGGRPSALHNNCSGKHAGFLCVCRQAGWSMDGYVKPSHPLQEHIRATLEEICGSAIGEAECGIDGCSIPTYAVPLKNLAQGFARLATGIGLAPGRAKAARRLMTACMEEPFLVAGTGRADTSMMEAGQGRVFTKTGAEGVFCAALPELGLGIALKCDDGATRAAETMVAAVIAMLLGQASDCGPEPFRRIADKPITNWNGIAVGEIRSTSDLRG